MVLPLMFKSLMKVIEDNKCTSAFITNPSNIIYFTKLPVPKLPPPSGYYLLVSENVTYLIVPALDYWRVNELLSKYYNVIPYSKYELPNVELGTEVIKDVSKFILEKSGEGSRVCTDCRDVNILSKLEKNHEVINVGKELLKLRSIKSVNEIELMKQALRITEECISRIIESLSPGIKELEIVGLIEGMMRSLGAEGPAFSTIVASGRNSSHPHAVPTNREISKGEPVIIDVGASYGGYSSDMTRTLAIEPVSRELKQIIGAVEEAINVAIDYVREGVSCREVDAKAREVLKKYGLDKYFIHGLGHGVGIDVHEPPYLSPGSNDVLRENMVVTIEPGVYINGKYGVRIENMVVVKKSGCEVLNKLPLSYLIH